MGMILRPKERQIRIMDVVERSGETTVEALAATFAVSAETIRRDLSQLAQNGALQKVHGGARRLQLHFEGSFDDRLSERSEGKALIAQKLRDIIAPGDTLFLDTGTTTLACAQSLAQIKGLTIITNSIRIAQVVGRAEGGAKIYLVGGSFAPDNGETVGPLAIEQIAQFRADHAVIGVAALDAAGGAMASDFDEAAVARAMCAHAGQIIIVADCEKIGRSAAHLICRLEDVDLLITDENPPLDFSASLAAARVELR